MSYFSDGENSDNNNKTLFEKGQQFIDSKLTKLYINNVRNSVDEFNVSIFDYLDAAHELLINVNILKERLNFELGKYGKTTSYPNSLDSYERIGEFNFFITVLGYLDSKISSCNKEIEFNEAFFEYDETAAKKYTEYKNFREFLLIEREKVVCSYKNYLSINCNPEEGFEECLDTIPCSKDFGKLCTQEFNNKSFSNLLNKFIIAYNVGYSSSNANYKKVLLKYKELYNELDNYLNNKCSFQKKKTNEDK